MDGQLPLDRASIFVSPLMTSLQNMVVPAGNKEALDASSK
jgi:hypothetical protein